MCAICGCGAGSGAGKGQAAGAPGHDHDHDHDHGRGHHHDHDHEHHDHDHDHHHDHGHDHAHDGHGHRAAAPSPARLIKIEQDILGYNDAFAAENRARFRQRGVLALNLVSSPGSGKTTLLCRTASDLKRRYPIAVIEGDQQTSFDADRIRATGVPALQVNTGKGCHLDAHMVGHAAEKLGLDEQSVLFIENVGNLVCPAGFDLGEAAKVVILSVTEGEDKPLKYPDMFAAAEVMLLNKIDLLPHLAFDVERCIGYARRVNPRIEVLRVSATGGQGLAEWYAWVGAKRQAALSFQAAAAAVPG